MTSAAIGFVSEWRALVSLARLSALTVPLWSMALLEVVKAWGRHSPLGLRLPILAPPDDPDAAQTPRKN